MRYLVLALSLSISAPAYAAGTTEAACLRSDRSPGREACACAQAVADQTLSQSDQKIAAKIIADPDHFYTYYGSDAPRRKAFLERYRNWGSLTEQHCSARR